MKLVLIEPEELKIIIAEVVAKALKQLPTPPPPEQIMKRIDVAKKLKVSLVTVSAWVMTALYHTIESTHGCISSGVKSWRCLRQRKNIKGVNSNHKGGNYCHFMQTSYSAPPIPSVFDEKSSRVVS